MYKINKMNTQYNEKQIKFLDSQTENNETWAAKQILAGMTEHQRKVLYKTLDRIEDLLYKSWSKELPIKTLFEIRNELKIIE